MFLGLIRISSAPISQATKKAYIALNQAVCPINGALNMLQNVVKGTKVAKNYWNLQSSNQKREFDGFVDWYPTPQDSVGPTK